MAWNAETYLRFGNERTRAAADLLSRVPLQAPKAVVDLGCGPGNSTALLRERYPDAQITGLDSSEVMIAAAQASGVRADFVQATVEAWKPAAPLDLIYANATLHWLDDHQRLFPRLASYLAPEGVLAVQMPCNFKAPSHALLFELAGSARWKSLLAGNVRSDPVAEPATYYRWLKSWARQSWAGQSSAVALDVFEIDYLQVLNGDDPVLTWVRGTVLVPYLEALAAEEARDFEAEYRERLRAAYPKEPGGETLFPFKRIFLVLQLPRSPGAG